MSTCQKLAIMWDHACNYRALLHLNAHIGMYTAPTSFKDARYSLIIHEVLVALSISIQ
jgi:hypothetical protein